ncbi:MAG: teichoic acid transport system permease protein [Actinomycetota bacterium]|nr:teichoic acid transport system permease protein [Actinomycetota bacterium]
MSQARSSTAEDEYNGERHVYEPHRAGLPPLVPYFRELWRRRTFAFELSRTSMHAANTDTVFGQAWLVINPLLLSGVYYILVDIIGGGASKADPGAFFALLTSGLFLYYYITGSMSAGTTAVTQGGRLILNTSFPKMLLTVSTVYTAFRRFLPTLIVYFGIHLITGQKVGFHLLWLIPILIMATMMGLGLANLFATLQVYFRDTASFLPYVIRIWLYLSPVLWTIEMAKERAGKGGQMYQLLLTWSPINPMYGILGAQGEVLVGGTSPSWDLLAYGFGWSALILVAGSLLMMSREREFAVRL